MPKSNRLAEGETKLCTSGEENKSKELDSGLTRALLRAQSPE